MYEAAFTDVAWARVAAVAANTSQRVTIHATHATTPAVPRSSERARLRGLHVHQRVLVSPVRSACCSGHTSRGHVHVAVCAVRVLYLLHSAEAGHFSRCL